MAASSSHFLILDKYEYHGKTQITLLHLPNDKRWKLFQNVKFSVFDDIVNDTRKRFENKCGQEVIPELATHEWLKRCFAPLGIIAETSSVLPQWNKKMASCAFIQEIG